MSPIQRPINVTLTNQNSTITVKVTPPSLRIPGNTPTQQYEIVLNASGPSAAFPQTNFFRWKTGSGQPRMNVNSTGSQIKSDPFTNPNTGVTPLLWEYEVTIGNGAVTVIIDPEVNNEPPTGPGPIDLELPEQAKGDPPRGPLADDEP